MPTYFLISWLGGDRYIRLYDIKQNFIYLLSVYAAMMIYIHNQTFWKTFDILCFRLSGTILDKKNSACCTIQKICMYSSPVHLKCSLCNITIWLTDHLAELNVYALPILQRWPNCIQYMKPNVSLCSLQDSSLPYTHLVSQTKSDHMLLTYRPVNKLLTGTNSHHSLRFNGDAAFKRAMQHEFFAALLSRMYPNSIIARGTIVPQYLVQTDCSLPHHPL
jgi:hypothetical protein